MSTYDLEEQEQLASLKAWWRQYGNLVIGIALIVSLVFSGWTGWSWYQRSQAGNASVLYEQLQKSTQINDVKSAKDAAGAILEQYPRTIYAPLAAMVLARLLFQAGDIKTARAQLEWAVKNAKSPEVRSVARLRLATVLIDDNAASEAVRVLEEKPENGFESLFAAARGDAYLADRKRDEAVAAYKAALAAENGLDTQMRELLKIKLATLGS